MESDVMVPLLVENAGVGRAIEGVVVMRKWRLWIRDGAFLRIVKVRLRVMVEDAALKGLEISHVHASL